jgi:ATP-dependent exoDNAse (exonuclease V) alpha subunit
LFQKYWSIFVYYQYMTTAPFFRVWLTGGTHVEKLIENIIAADRKAREIIEKAEMQKESIIAETAKEKAKAIENYRSSFARAEEQLNEEEQAKRDEIAAEEEADFAQRKEALCKTVEEHRSAWADAMFQKITAV